MKIINREMKAEIEHDSNGSLSCQASFNSDGCITLRNYNRHQKDKDEIIILNGDETVAIIKLFKQLGKHTINDLPF